MKRILAIATPLLLLASCSDFNAGAMGNGELKEILRQYNDLEVENIASESLPRYKYQNLADWGSNVILHNPQSVQTAAPDLQLRFLKAFEDCWAKAGYSQNPYVSLQVRYSSAKQAASRQAAAKSAVSQPVKAKQETKPAKNATKHDSPKKPAQSGQKQNKAATSRTAPQKEVLYNKAKAQPDNFVFDPKPLRP